MLSFHGFAGLDSAICLGTNGTMAPVYCHRLEPYRSFQPNASLLLPETERLASRNMVLPTRQAMTTESVDAIGQIIRTTPGQSDAICTGLAEL